MSTLYTVIFSKLAQEQFDEIISADRRLGAQISKAIDRLASNPESGKLLMGEWKGYRRFRSGDYRVIYRIDGSRLIILILAIGNRKDIYD